MRLSPDSNAGNSHPLCRHAAQYTSVSSGLQWGVGWGTGHSLYSGGGGRAQPLQRSGGQGTASIYSGVGDGAQPLPWSPARAAPAGLPSQAEGPRSVLLSVSTSATTSAEPTAAAPSPLARVAPKHQMLSPATLTKPGGIPEYWCWPSCLPAPGRQACHLTSSPCSFCFCKTPSVLWKEKTGRVNKARCLHSVILEEPGFLSPGNHFQGPASCVRGSLSPITDSNLV